MSADSCKNLQLSQRNDGPEQPQLPETVLCSQERERAGFLDLFAMLYEEDNLKK